MNAPANAPGGIFGRIRASNAGRMDALALVGDARSVRRSYSYGDLFAAADAAAAGFVALGVAKGDRVGIAAENFDLWIVSDLALLSIGAVGVPRGGDASTAEIAFCLEHAGCRASLFETAELYARVKDSLSAMDVAIVMKGPASEGAISFEDLLAKGRELAARDPDAVARRRADVGDADLATIVYTSGTTGNPKGVVLTHGNLLHNMRSLPRLFAFRPGMRFVSFLPTWHTFERTVEYIVLDNGLELHYSSKRTLKADLARVRPQFLVGVPRVWETFHQGVASAIEKLPPAKRKLVAFLLFASKAAHRARRRAVGLEADKRDGAILRSGPFGRAAAACAAALAAPAEFLARRLVYSKLSAGMGGELQIAISGGGPLPPEVEEFFLRAGIPFYNGYGLTETSPVVSVRIPGRNVMGTIGPPLPDTEVRVVAENGTVLQARCKGVLQVRGPQVMRGYWNNERATAACLTSDGWFDTGDIGLVSSEGDVLITGRAKDTIVLRGGENVEPENIETALSGSPCFLDVVVVGHAQKSLAALIVPDFEVVRGRIPGLPEATPDQLIKLPAVVDHIRRELAAYVNSQRGFRTFEMIGRFACLPAPFSTEDGTLTHTMKKKRRVIEERHAALIDSLYAD